jgi:cell division protein FtsI (penicillin-binding protein 3)
LLPAPAARWLRIRLVFTALVLLGLLGALGYKAFTVQIRDGARMRALGEAQYLHEMELPAPRGSIRDVHGVDMAVSVDTDSIFANPRAVRDARATAKALSGALGIPWRELEKKLAETRYFVWLKRRVTGEASAKVRALDLPGIGSTAEPRRFYPGKSLAGPVLGFAGLDGKGLEGIELSLDTLLRGEKTTLPAIRDARGNLLLGHTWTDVEPASAGGGCVTLSLDRFLQYTAEQALEAAVTLHRAKAGVVVVLDPKSSDVLALASFPTYDPNDPSHRGDAKNRAVTDAYEVGSVMKVFSVAAALDAQVVKPTDVFDIEGGRLQIGAKTITDTHKGESLLTVTEVIKYSSNVGAVKIARKLGKEALHDTFAELGFGQVTGIELPGERAGVLRDTRRWGEIGLATASFGYGLTVTPLQLATALSAVASGGVLHPPRLVKRVVAPDGRVLVESPPDAGRRVLSEAAARDLAAMLKTVVEKGGTGEKVVVPGFVVAGKTGTAHKHDPQTGTYAADRYLSSFMGFAPADDPRLTIVVLIDDPRGESHFGGVVAGPVFARIASEGLKYLGVSGTVPLPEPSATEPVAAAPEAGPPVPPVTSLESSLAWERDDLPPAGPGEPIVLIPDFTGLSVGQALAWAHKSGIRLEIEGSGRAVRQFPQPGRALKSIPCLVTFNPG